MSWQDREYARPTRPRGPSFLGGGPGYLIGGSIVTTLIAINAVIFVLGAMSPHLHALFQGVYGLTRAGQGVAQAGWFELRGDLVARGQVWRLITAQYLHAGIGHIAFNMIALHFLGRPLETLWSVRRLFGVYTICGVAGNVFYALLGSQGYIDPMIPAVGASGSIYGLLGIVAVMFPTATVYVYFLFPVKIRTAAIILGLIAFFTIQTRGGNYGGEACHLAGLVFGVWWAARGQYWWEQTEWRFLPKRSRSATTRSPGRRSGGFAERVQERREDAATLDRILKKVGEGGIHTLTEGEKKTLREATDRERDREAEFDRAERR
jgi:membrane associated rhomboid family serine protease